MILTAEADNLPANSRQPLEDCGLVGCHSAKNNYLSTHGRMNSTGYVGLLWESNEEEDNDMEALKQ